nr:hypothetical protein [Saprospiraceae bacterium]
MSITKYLLNSIYLLAIGMLLMGCGSDKAYEGQFEHIELEGVWEIVNASRNGNPTTTLDGGEFVFTGDQFTSNVPGLGDNIQGEYTVSGDSIYTGIPRPEYFLIRIFFEDRMELFTVVQGHHFVFEVERMNSNE